MGLLDSVIGGVLGQVLGGGRSGNPGGAAGGAMSPIVKALLMLLLAKGASGGLGGALGDVFGGGQRRPEPGPDTERSGGAGPYGRDPGHSADDSAQDPGDIGGFDQEGGRRDAPLPPGDYSDLSGMLDGPSDRANVPQSGNVSHETSGQIGGLDGLVDRFRQGGLGDVIDSWIGHGSNRSIEPHDLARALGPDTLGALQSQTGMDRDSLLSQLSQVLPEVVHGLTPQGRVPDAGERRGW
ncbi:YidB family protein [Methylobacterium sp. E-041]|uniref:YidB family protein n=1 Tax=Methylobacterium sp. E-041 TaxID=2836573 RepID=UPI001FBB7EB7|nr:YidB family protein [Methylobacterium sp. E-041]MCJ2104992.1 YidB family protein [Methylobacterium sp. E-041]